MSGGVNSQYQSLTQGARANVAGKVFEQTLKGAFEAYGFEIVNWAKWRDRHVPLEESGRIVIHEFPYHTIYNHRGTTEWLIVNNERGVICRVEVKTQRGSGSVDEKIPYMYLNGALAYPEDDIAFVVEGDGFKPGMRPWLRNAIDTRWCREPDDDRHIEMYTVGEFIAYFIENLA